MLKLKTRLIGVEDGVEGGDEDEVDDCYALLKK